MNNTRRRAIKQVVAQFENANSILCDLVEALESIKSDVEDIQSEEEEARDNMPESLQDSERYEKADAACENLADAVDTLDEILDDLKIDFSDVVTSLEEAME